MRITTFAILLAFAVSSVSGSESASRSKRLLVTGLALPTLPPEDSKAAKELFFQTLGEIRQGVFEDRTDSSCLAISCAAPLLSARGADQALWFSMVRLGGTFNLSASLFHQGDSQAVVRRTTLQTLDDLPKSYDQLLRAVFDGTSVAEAATIDNIGRGESENTPLRRRSLAMSGITLGMLYPVGRSSYQREIHETRRANVDGIFTSLDSVRYRRPTQNLMLGYSYWNEFSQNLALDADFRANLPSALAFQADVVGFYSRGDIAPFVGGGLGVEYVLPDDPDPEDKINVGPQVNVQTGVMLFRTYDVRAMVRGGYQITFNTDKDQGLYAEIGLLYAPTKKSGSTSEGSAVGWLIAALGGLLVLGLASSK